MAELTEARVCEIFDECLRDGKASEVEKLKIEGVIHAAMLGKRKLDEHRAEITELLLELPDDFRRSGGGGMSLLNACCDRHGRQWADLHLTMEKLFMLGMAIEKVKPLFLREIWPALPGGMPYYVVLDESTERTNQ